MHRQLHTMDSLFLFLEKSDYQVDITPVFFYDPAGAEGGNLTHVQLLEHFRETVEMVPALRSRLERVPFDLDNPYLAEDPNFRIEDHFREVEVPTPGDWDSLRELLADFQSRPLDTGRPLWEALIVRGLGGINGMPEGTFALALKIHHVIADGHTAIDITSRLHDEGRAQLDASERTSRVEFQAPNYYNRLGQVVTNNLVGALEMMNPLLNTLPRVSKTLFETVSKDRAALTRLPVSTRFNRKSEGKECTWTFASLDLAAAKRISKLESGATVNDVVLTTVAGAMREYLQDKGDSTDKCLRALAPVNVRHESEHNAAGNQVSAMLPDLPVQLEDPRERLIAVMRSSALNKKIAKEIGSREVTDLMKNVPPAWMASLRMMGVIDNTTTALLPLLCSALVTNVPGPGLTLHMAGARLLNMAGMIVPCEFLGLQHVVNSYDGKLNVAVTMKRSVLPDSDFYRECLERSFDRLLAAYPAAAESPVATASHAAAA